MLQFLNGYDSYTCMQIQMRAHYPKVSSYMKETCRSEGIKVTKDVHKLCITLTFLILLHAGIRQNILKSYFAKKQSNLSSLLGPKLSLACYGLYKLRPKTCCQFCLSVLWLSGDVKSYNSQCEDSSSFEIQT